MAARLDQDDDLKENSEINMTPFIDVMLVLLIVFMVAAPLATVDVKVDLPTSIARPAAKDDKPVYLTIAADRSLSVGNDTVATGDLKAAIVRATGNDPERRILLRADKRIDYDTLMRVMNELRAAGYTRIALVAAEQADAR